VDCALFIDKCCFEVGICFLDSSGHLVQAYTKCFSYIIQVIECEATYILIAMKIAANKGFECIAYKIDNQYVVHVVLSGCIYENELDTIVTTCRSYIPDHASFYS